MQSRHGFPTYRLRRLALAIALLGGVTALSGAAPASAGAHIPLVDMGGSGGGGSVATIPAPYAGSANQRSLDLVESREAAAVTVAYDPGAAVNFCIGCVLDSFA
jgi:hypothetical protein